MGADMTSAVAVEIPMALPSAGNLHEHWRKRHQRVKTQRSATRLALNVTAVGNDLLPMGFHDSDRLAVTFTRISPRRLDDDNLAFAFKGGRDEVAAYFGVNDN